MAIKVSSGRAASDLWLVVPLLIPLLSYGQQKPDRPTMCGEIALIQSALNHLPPELQFPCDANHVRVIQNLASFLKSHPEIAANARVRATMEGSIAFTVGPAWPVYINLSSHQALFEAYRPGGMDWLTYVFAAVLAHERVHATGNLSEAAGLFAEFQLDQRFRAEGKLPAAFDLQGLQRQFQQALKTERTGQ